MEFPMKFQASLSSLPKMLEYVSQELDACNYINKEQYQIELSLEEALVNIINYAYPEKPGELEILCSKKPNTFVITIKDWGIPFDPTEQQRSLQHETPVEKRKVGGLGLFFIHELMDDVSYTHDGKANILTLTKSVSQNP